MKMIFTAIILVLAILAVSEAYAGTAYFTHSVESGATKQCFYTYNTKTYVRTVNYIDVCPYTIRVPDAF